MTAAGQFDDADIGIEFDGCGTQQHHKDDDDEFVSIMLENMMMMLLLTKQQQQQQQIRSLLPLLGLTRHRCAVRALSEPYGIRMR